MNPLSAMAGGQRPPERLAAVKVSETVGLRLLVENSHLSLRRNGVVLVLVLWLLVVLGLLLLGLNRSAQVAGALAGNEVQRVQARWLARAGLEQALAVLAGDDPGSDGTADLWYDDPLAFEDVELAEGFVFRVTAPPAKTAEADSVRFGLDDEAGRVNLNTARFNQLANLNRVTDVQADAILDWIDTNERTRPGGAERGYYAELDQPYLIANAPLRTPRELLLIKGIEVADALGEDVNGNARLERNENDGDVSWPPDNADRQLDRGLLGLTTIYSYEPNLSPLGLPRTNLLTADADTLVEQFNFTPALAEAMIQKVRNDRPDDLFDFVGTAGTSEESTNTNNNPNSRGGNTSSDSEAVAPDDPEAINEFTLKFLADNWEYFSLSDEPRLPGKINLNTASRTVLESIPQMDPAVADAIVNARVTSGDFLTVGELLSRGLVNEQQFPRVAPTVTVQSGVFRVVSTGQTPSGLTATLAAVIDRGGDRPVVLDWREQP